MRTQPLKNTYYAFLILIFLGLGFFGALYYWQHQPYFNAHRYSTAEIIRTRALAHRLQDAEYRIAHLESEIAEMQLQTHEWQRHPDADRLTSLSRFIGLTSQSGPGLVVTLKDSAKPLLLGDNPNNGLIHNTDLVEMVNELRSAGAKGIAINGQPVVGMTGINCAGPIITINGSRIASPFKISALGDPNHLAATLNKPGSFMRELEKYDIEVDFKPQPVTIPAYEPGAVQS